MNRSRAKRSPNRTVKYPSKYRKPNQPKPELTPSPSQPKPEMVPSPGQPELELDLDLDTLPANKIRVTERDLETDEALWKVYRRWCVFFEDELHRTHEEMEERFINFKKTAIEVVGLNNRPNDTCRFCMNQWSDLTDEEMDDFLDCPDFDY